MNHGDTEDTEKHNSQTGSDSTSMDTTQVAPITFTSSPLSFSVLSVLSMSPWYQFEL